MSLNHQDFTIIQIKWKNEIYKVQLFLVGGESLKHI